MSARKVLIGTSELLAVKSKGSYDVSGEPQWQPEWRAVVMAKINVYLEQLCFRPHYLPILPSPSLAEFEYDIPFDNSETWRLRDQGRFNQAAGADSQSGARPQEESFGADDGWPDEDAARRHELQEEEEAQDATDEDLGKIDHK